jgi:hypothetical protein
VNERTAGWRDAYLWLALLLTLFALGPLLQPGYFWGAHDARHSVYFLFEFDRSVQDGALYPRWQPDFAFGYGYPFFNIYGPLPYFAGEAFHLLGFGFVDAVKIVFGLSIVLSGLGMYLFLRRLAGRPAALLGSLVYVYLPYHLFDVYVRAALGESVAYAAVPFVLWGFHEATRRPALNSIAGAGVAYAALMFSSNLIALMFTPVLALYVLVLILARALQAQPASGWSRESLWPGIANLLHQAGPPLLALLIGLGLSAIFWLPALTEARYVRADQWLARYDYHDDFVYFFQLFSPHWGFGTSGAGPNDDVGFQLGVVPLALAFFSPLALRAVRRPETRRLFIFCQLLLIGAAFMAMAPAAPIWERLALVRYAQFPWRYFALAAPALAVLSAAALAGEEDAPARWPRWAPAILLAGLALLGSYPYLRAEIREPAEGPVSLASLMRFQRVSDHMTGATIWTPQIPSWSPMADIWIKGGQVTTRVDYSGVPQTETLAVDSREMNATHELVWVYARDAGQQVRFYRFYYPGWRAYILDEKTRKVVQEAPIATTGPQGLITVPVPAGRHFLLLRFEDTPPRIIGSALSGLTLAGLALLLAARRLLRTGSRRYA